MLYEELSRKERKQATKTGNLVTMVNAVTNGLTHWYIDQEAHTIERHYRNQSEVRTLAGVKAEWKSAGNEHTALVFSSSADAFVFITGPDFGWVLKGNASDRKLASFSVMVHVAAMATAATS